MSAYCFDMHQNCYFLFQISDAAFSLMSATIAIFPPLYFFSFLYYTDAGSTFFVLITYLFNIYRCHPLAATSGAISVLFRQTNIVWIAFFASLAASDVFMEFVHDAKNDESSHEDQGNIVILQNIFNRLQKSVRGNGIAARNLIYDLFSVTWAYAVVAFGFVVFVVINGSIVVGAKHDHAAGLHVPQIFYFAAFACAFLAVHVVTIESVASFMTLLRRRTLVLLLCMVLFTVAIWCFTYTHRYLVSDNRHYTFYVWSRVFQRHPTVRYALIPGYLYAIWTLMLALEHRNILWKIAYCTCVAVNLVPATLLEFRYFVVPYLILRLNIRPSSTRRLLLELLFHVSVNTFTLYMFIEKPFQWESEPGRNQRFMW